MNRLVSQAAYARMRKVSRAAISQAVARGDITLINGMIDPAVADIQWFNGSRAAAAALPSTLPDAPRSAASDPGRSTQDDATWRQRRDAQARREQHEANIAEMREAQMAGELIDRDQALRALADCAALLRQALERFPDKLAERLAAEADPGKCYAMLEAEVEQLLGEVAVSIQRLVESNCGTTH